jgi:hypothetical protein
MTGKNLSQQGKQSRGRPAFQWTDDIEEDILAGIVAGKSIREIVMDGGEGFPSADTIYRHIAADVNFCDKYTRARELQQDTYAEEIIAIADGHHPNFIGKEADEKRLAIETRKWTMGKLRAKKYNDKIVAEITGANGAPLIPTRNIDVASLTDEQRDALRFAITAIESREGEVEDADYTEGEN